MSFLPYFLDALVNVGTLTTLVMKSVVLILIAWLSASLLRQSGSALRHRIWVAAIVSSLLLPFLAFVTPSWQLALIPVSFPLEQKVSNPVGAQTDGPASPERKPYSTRASFSARQASSIADLPPARLASSQNFALRPKLFVFCIWSLGFVFLLILNLAGLARLRRLKQEAKSVSLDHHVQFDPDVVASLGVRRKIRMLESSDIVIPLTWGIFRPIILMPASAQNWPLEWRRCALLHELAHVKRLDCLTQGLATFACMIYWFNPLMWLAARHLRIERELACDETVIANGMRATDYAQALLDIARSVGATNHVPPLAVGLAHSDLERRIRAIVTPIPARFLFGKASLMTTAALICIILAIAPLQIVAVGQDITTFTNFALQQVPQNSPQKPEIEFTPEFEPPAEETEADAAEDENVDQEAKLPDDGNEFPKAGSVLEFDSASMEFLDVDPYVPTPQQEILMKIHGVTPEFIESFYQLGYPNLPIYQLLSMAQLNITADYIREIQTLGYDDIWVGDLIYVRKNEMSLEKLREIKEQYPETSSLNKIHYLLTKQHLLPETGVTAILWRKLQEPVPKTKRALTKAFIRNC
jgi:beta-lactamase regulating signal transducer with metallopeptidase domain